MEMNSGMRPGLWRKYQSVEMSAFILAVLCMRICTLLTSTITAYILFLSSVYYSCFSFLMIGKCCCQADSNNTTSAKCSCTLFSRYSRLSRARPTLNIKNGQKIDIKWYSKYKKWTEIDKENERCWNGRERYLLYYIKALVLIFFCKKVLLLFYQPVVPQPHFCTRSTLSIFALGALHFARLLERQNPRQASRFGVAMVYLTLLCATLPHCPHLQLPRCLILSAQPSISTSASQKLPSPGVPCGRRLPRR